MTESVQRFDGAVPPRSDERGRCYRPVANYRAASPKVSTNRKPPTRHIDDAQGSTSAAPIRDRRRLRQLSANPASNLIGMFAQVLAPAARYRPFRPLHSPWPHSARSRPLAAHGSPRSVVRGIGRPISIRYPRPASNPTGRTWWIPDHRLRHAADGTISGYFELSHSGVHEDKRLACALTVRDMVLSIHTPAPRTPYLDGLSPPHRFLRVARRETERERYDAAPCCCRRHLALLLLVHSLSQCRLDGLL